MHRVSSCVGELHESLKSLTKEATATDHKVVHNMRDLECNVLNLSLTEHAGQRTSKISILLGNQNSEFRPPDVGPILGSVLHYHLLQLQARRTRSMNEQPVQVRLMVSVSFLEVLVADIRPSSTLQG